MSNIPFDDFLPEVMPECVGAPYPVAINAIRNACFDFCNESLLWNELQDAVTVAAGSTECDIDAPSGAKVAMVMDLYFDGALLTPMTSDDLAMQNPGWMSQTGTPVSFLATARDVVRLIPAPVLAGSLVAHVAYAPARTATAIERRIYDDYLETIKYGALWKLKRMVGTPWFEANTALYAQQMFRNGIDAAKVERIQSSSRASLRVMPRRFA